MATKLSHRKRTDANLELQSLQQTLHVQITNLPKAVTSQADRHYEQVTRILSQIQSQRKQRQLPPVISVGTRVTFQVLPDGEPESYLISDPRVHKTGNGSVSFAAPIGRALLGKSPNDVVTVHSPNGDYQIKVLTIEVEQ